VTVVGRDLLTQAGHLAIRVSVQGKIADRIGQRSGEVSGQRVWTLVGVEPSHHLQLWGCVGLDVANPGPRLGRGAHGSTTSVTSARAFMARA
jgi:hypothetical protein